MTKQHPPNPPCPHVTTAKDAVYVPPDAVEIQLWFGKSKYGQPTIEACERWAVELADASCRFRSATRPMELERAKQLAHLEKLAKHCRAAQREIFLLKKEGYQNVPGDPIENLSPAIDEFLKWLPPPAKARSAPVQQTLANNYCVVVQAMFPRQPPLGGPDVERVVGRMLLRCFGLEWGNSGGRRLREHAAKLEKIVEDVERLAKPL